MEQGFIYIWHDKVRNMFYIGSHKGKISDNYLSSSRWLNGEIRYRPNDFRRKILKFLPYESLVLEEYRLISMIKDSEYGRKYYNLKQGAPAGNVPWNKGRQGVYTEEHRKRISEWRKGVPTTKGRKNPIAAENGKKGAAKLSATTTGRKRKYLDDGSWTWEYPKK